MADYNVAETRAFGKLILFGEHFVVYKVPALVGAVVGADRWSSSFLHSFLGRVEQTVGSVAFPSTLRPRLMTPRRFLCCCRGRMKTISSSFRRCALSLVHAVLRVK